MPILQVIISIWGIWLTTNNKSFSRKIGVLSHWKLRDEIKANYANKEVGLKKPALGLQSDGTYH
jgi:hypothetical protein